MPGIQLKGGHTTTDVRLDRLPSFDPRSRAFPVGEVVPQPVHTKLWGLKAWLDQRQEGACVSFAWHHEAAASPVPAKVTDDDAFRRYREMQRVDEWPGESYSGTSVLAGAKVMHGAGFFSEYRWAFSIDELLRAVSHEGPAVIGIPWKDSMFSPRSSGLLDCSGQTAGGHAILVRGIVLKPRLKGESKLPPLLRLHNSWGKGWGVNGDCYVTAFDLERLLDDDGDACVPVGRRKP